MLQSHAATMAHQVSRMRWKLWQEQHANGLEMEVVTQSFPGLPHHQLNETEVLSPQEILFLESSKNLLKFEMQQPEIGRILGCWSSAGDATDQTRAQASFDGVIGRK